MRKFLLVALVIIVLAGCSPTSAISTIAPASTQKPVTVSLVPNQMNFEDYIHAILIQENIKLRGLKTSAVDRYVEVEIEPLDGSDPFITAQKVMGMLVKSMTLVQNETARAHTLRVIYDGPNGKLRALKLIEPTITQFLTGAITEEQVVKLIIIEEMKD